MDLRGQLINDLSILSGFLVWAETDKACMYGSYTPTQALEALARMVSVLELTPNYNSEQILARLRSMRE